MSGISLDQILNALIVIFCILLVLGVGGFAYLSLVSNSKKNENPVDDIQRENMRNLYGDNTK